MTYNKTVWQDRAVETPNKLKLIKEDLSEEIVTYEKVEGEIFQEGTPVNATRLNNLENEVDSLNDEVSTHLADYATFVNSKGQPEGLAELDVTGNVPESQLPELKIALLPSNEILFANTETFSIEANSHQGQRLLKRMHLSYAGSYRFMCEMRGNTTESVVLTAHYENLQIGRAQINTSTYTPISIDLGAVPPNATIEIRIYVSAGVDRTVWVRNISIGGYFGYRDISLF